MTGKGYIVVSIDQPVPRSGSFFEHESVEAARVEAQRLTLLHDSQFVIYEPVLLCRPMPKVQFISANLERDDEIPF